MSAVLPCPAWCVEHDDPDPFAPGDGCHHCGRERPVLLERPARSGLPVLFVQLNAHDCHGLRYSWIELVAPSRVHSEMTAAQARQLAGALVAGGDLWDSRILADGLLQAHPCPPWCRQHDEAMDPKAEQWHSSRPWTVPVIGPQLSGSRVRVRLCAKDTRFDRRLAVALTVREGETTELTGPEARRIAAALLDAADDLDSTL
ncbi:DUF6907 domain-containing protein [Nocardia sp. NPDC004711]